MGDEGFLAVAQGVERAIVGDENAERYMVQVVKKP